MAVQDTSTVASEALQNLLRGPRPTEGLRVLVVGIHEGLNAVDQLVHACVDAVLELTLGEEREDDLHQVQP
ncbi:MAG: hypothetical protein AAGA48_18410 [Myxococcota bacterium]